MWVARWVQHIEKADDKGDSKEVSRGVDAVSGRKKNFATKQPTKKPDGSRIQGAEDLSQLWHDFLAGKFSATELEAARREYNLPPQGDDGFGGADTEKCEGCVLSKAEFVSAVQRMKLNKSPGPDGIPAEVWKKSVKASEYLFTFLSKVWELEYVPKNLVLCVFVLIYKNKGSSDDCKKYRAIGLLNHSYKILSIVLLHRLVKECGHFFSDWQAGFRQQRGCRDNVLLLRILYDQIIRDDTTCCVTFIDYTAAFDSVSHKYLDYALQRAGASRKTRAMFRAIYRSAAGTARVNGLDGKKLFSKTFKVSRGVIQGDIISPIFFILALDQLFQERDIYGEGQAVGDIITLRVLGYADDAAMIEPLVETMTKRLTTVADASIADADMHVSMDKTYTQHVKRQTKSYIPSPNRIEKVEKTYKHKCPFCDRRFKTAAGVQLHREKHCAFNYATTEEVFEVEGIEDVFGLRTNRWFLVRFVGHPTPEWQREHLLRRDGCGEAIRDFWAQSSKLACTEVHEDPQGAHRCYVCARSYRRLQDLKAHKTRRRHWIKDMPKTTKSAERDAIQDERKRQQDLEEHVMWGREKADNCWQFIYLGSVFQADGDVMPDVKRRVAMAQTRAGKLRHVWAAKTLHLRLRFRLYAAGVCSVMTYDSEAWFLTKKVCGFLTSANARMMARITGRKVHEEAGKSKTFDLVKWIRARRLKWVGHILRLEKEKTKDGKEEERLLKRALQHVHAHRKEGDILMDVPNLSWEELQKLAADKDVWKSMVRAIKETNISKWQRMTRRLREIQISKRIGARYVAAVEAAAEAAAMAVRQRGLTGLTGAEEASATRTETVIEAEPAAAAEAIREEGGLNWKDPREAEAGGSAGNAEAGGSARTAKARVDNTARTHESNRSHLRRSCRRRINYDERRHTDR